MRSEYLHLQCRVPETGSRCLWNVRSRWCHGRRVGGRLGPLLSRLVSPEQDLDMRSVGRREEGGRTMMCPAGLMSSLSSYSAIAGLRDSDSSASFGSRGVIYAFKVKCT